MDERYVPLGVVARPFGVPGEIKIKPHNPDTDWFDRAEGVWLRSGSGGEPELYRLLKSRRHKKIFIIVALEGVADRDRAEELRGFEAVAPESALGELEEDEYYWYQLEGLSVETTDGKRLGEVIRMEETAPHLDAPDLFVVLGEGGETLIPATDEAVAEVDLSKNRLIVHPIPGLTVPD